MTSLPSPVAVSGAQPHTLGWAILNDDGSLHVVSCNDTPPQQVIGSPLTIARALVVRLNADGSAPTELVERLARALHAACENFDGDRELEHPFADYAQSATRYARSVLVALGVTA